MLLRLLTLAAVLALPALAWPQGRVVQALGQASADAAPLAVGSTVDGGVLRTGADAQLQLRLADGAMLVLPADSEVRLASGAAPQLELLRGGLRLASGKVEWRVELGQRSIRSTGYLKLQQCGSGCDAPPGLYGSTALGEAVLEYAGGRSVLRNRQFRWTGAARPELLAAQPALLADDTWQAQAAQRRAAMADVLERGAAAFRDGDDERARSLLAEVREAVPGETLVPYYLGLIALRQHDNDTALRELQQYAREDPEGATARNLPQTLTLLASSQLRDEVAGAIAREKVESHEPPEPNSIAVEAFVNRGGDDAYRPLAKGLAAMIIADLSKVPGLKVLEREKVQLLVNEMKLGDSGLTDPAAAVRTGRMMRAEKVIVGNFEVQ